MPKTNSDARTRANNGEAKYQGMNWIRQDKRLAIYLRDGLACAYCGAGLESGITFTLDHLVPHSLGGDNSARNLVTCCRRCNSARGNRNFQIFAKSVADYVDHGVTALEIIEHIRSCTKQPLKAFRAEAKQLIERRGSAAKVLNHIA